MNYQVPTPVQISYKDIRWAQHTVRLVHVLNEPAGPPAFFHFTSPLGADLNQNANEAIAQELAELFAAEKVRVYLESTRFYFPPQLGLETFPAYAFEEDKNGWTALTLKTTFP